MAICEVSVCPPNSLILVGDLKGEVPEIDETLISATATCVAVGTLAEMNGETTIRLADTSDATATTLELAFRGELKTPSGRFTVASVLDEVYCEQPCALAVMIDI